MAENIKLDAHHRATLEKIYGHPINHNIQWHDVLSLLERAGTVAEEHDGKRKVTIGSETRAFLVPRHKEIDEQMVIDLRHLLKDAGITPEATSS